MLLHYYIMIKRALCRIERHLRVVRLCFMLLKTKIYLASERNSEIIKRINSKSQREKFRGLYSVGRL